jgi:hypothetical protein
LKCTVLPDSLFTGRMRTRRVSEIPARPNVVLGVRLLTDVWVGLVVLRVGVVAVRRAFRQDVFVVGWPT